MAEDDAVMATEEKKAEKKKKQPGRVRRGFAWAFGPFVSVTKWFGYEGLRDTTVALKKSAVGFMVPEKATYEEDFSTAQSRFNLTDEQVETKASDLLRLCLFFVLISFLILVYGFYLLFNGNFSSFFLTLVIGCFSLANAFRYHFWFFQVKNRKLGCTLKDWYNAKVSGEE